MTVGMVQWFDPERGYGFVRPDFGPCDVFMHASALPADACPAPGTRVEFELTQDAEGRPSAHDVREVAA